MQTDGEIASRIESLDLSLFDLIPSQSSSGDRRAWLAIQRAMRKSGAYTYLEIGSHLGGSLQQHIVDPLCRQIISIDKRPMSQPDDRGEIFVYQDNSTERMLKNLRRIAPQQLGKVLTFDADARDIRPQDIPSPSDFCFIDGEHTLGAVLSDFEFCLKVCTPNATIGFHDDQVIYPALRRIMSDLRGGGIPFTARKLTGGTFAIFLRDCPAIGDAYIQNNSPDLAKWLRNQQIRSWVPKSLRPLANSMVKKLLGKPAIA